MTSNTAQHGSMVMNDWAIVPWGECTRPGHCSKAPRQGSFARTTATTEKKKTPTHSVHSICQSVNLTSSLQMSTCANRIISKWSYWDQCRNTSQNMSKFKIFKTVGICRNIQNAPWSCQALPEHAELLVGVGPCEPQLVNKCLKYWLFVLTWHDCCLLQSRPWRKHAISCNIMQW